MGGDNVAHSCPPVLSCFNPRPRMGGDGFPPASPRRSKSFNPRPRMGGDLHQRQGRPNGLPVSIHAPAWGATPVIDRPAPINMVSIHAPAWGATGEGSTEVNGIRVSIHAPAWGATAVLIFSFDSLLFQSTPPHGGRRGGPLSSLGGNSFNPRPRMGGDGI